MYLVGGPLSRCAPRLEATAAGVLPDGATKSNALLVASSRPASQAESLANLRSCPQYTVRIYRQNIQLRICSQNIQLRIYNSEYMYLLAVAGAAQLQHRGEHQRRGVEVGVAGGCRARDGVGPDHAQRFPSRVLPRGPPLQSPCTCSTYTHMQYHTCSITYAVSHMQYHMQY